MLIIRKFVLMVYIDGDAIAFNFPIRWYLDIVPRSDVYLGIKKVKGPIRWLPHPFKFPRPVQRKIIPILFYVVFQGRFFIGKGIEAGMRIFLVLRDYLGVFNVVINVLFYLLGVER